MSRLIVKNLPKNITEDKIRELFGEKGTVTDIQLKYTSDGKFRQFGFVGYQTENEAEEASKYFDNMFIKTNKLKVEVCASLGDLNKPKAWSKYATDSTAYRKLNQLEESGKEEKEASNSEKKKAKDKKKREKVDESVELLSKYKDDPLFEEFLQVHAPQESEKLLKLTKNDSIENEEDSATKSENEDCEEEKADDDNKLADQQITDIEYMKKLMNKTGDEKISSNGKTCSNKKEKKNFQLFTVKLRDLPYNCKKKDIKDFFKPVTPFSIRIPTKIHGIAYIGFKTESAFNKAMLKDRSFISGKQINVLKYNNNTLNNEHSVQIEPNVRQNKWRNQEESLKNEEDIAESGRIFIRNLSYTTVEDDLEKLFSKYGPLAEVNLPVDANTRKLKGFGTVMFVMPEHAVKAYTELDGSILHGRMLHLLPGKSKDKLTDEDALEQDGKNYKDKKAHKEKSQSNSSHNWNALFMGHDAVAEVIADTYGTSKESVLLDGEGNAAVRLALGETEIVAQTRKYLEEQGVILNVFNNQSTNNKSIKRSKTIILVKNLPSKTEIKEIASLFKNYGLLGRVILPPSGITALVEFIEPSEARKAFMQLAYTKFKNTPLYLEWAPENSLADRVVVSEQNQGNEAIEIDEEKNNVLNKKEKESSMVDEEEPEPDTTLFVKNLNFITTDESLYKHFECCGKLNYATVACKKDKTNANNKLSMGYGFVRFFHKSSTDKALKTLQQSILDGKSLELKRSERTLINEVKTNRKNITKPIKNQTGTKILVRNVPFQANIKEIRELFSTFGEIKALRLPKKMALSEGSHKGFAFVDFVTASDAKSAFEALSQSTHLYGRRLVLEWAAADESVEEIRKRTADHFTVSETVKSKKTIFSMDD